MSFERRPLGDVPELTEAQWAWVAGVIEGEGSFGWSGAAHRNARLRVTMTDEDVVRRLQSLTGLGYVSTPKMRECHKKQPYTWVVGAHNEVTRVARYVYEWLGERRQAKCRELGLVPSA